ncbi:acyl-coenzyme A diphosphatase NUDT19 isoform X1 [Sander vitreus]
MNTNLKHWKEAATLILAAGHRLGADCLSARTPLGSSYGRSHLPHKSCFDYDVLLLKRSSKSGFMPNAYVFPGGMVDSSDFSSEWLDIFKSFRNLTNFGLRSVTQPLETRPPMFATDRLKLGSPIAGEVAFRICALRETFEESGVLLVVPKVEEKRLLKSIEDRCATDQVPHNNVSELCGSELAKWRALVNQNPSNFIRMCRELEVLPNIWALHEWGNWLTPTGRYGVTRFDTAFFICCLQEIPHTLHDEKEIVRFQWSTPSEVLQSYQARELWIAPPQFYELSRMCRLPLLYDIHNFSSQRATEGCEQWLPVVSLKDEHYISLLPGADWLLRLSYIQTNIEACQMNVSLSDKRYPLDTSGEAEVGASADPQLEDPQDDSALHRIVIVDPSTITLQITITPKYKHLLPVVEQTFPRDSKSQL